MQDYAVFLISDVFYVLISWSCSLDNSSSEKFFITPTIASSGSTGSNYKQFSKQ